MKKYDCIIIGAGVAGMTSAIYLKRFNINVLLLEKEIPGGQINKTSIIENYPGFDKIDGVTLSSKIYEQIKKLNIEYKYGNVLEIKDEKTKKIVKTDKEEYETKFIIIASGKRPRKLGLENEEKLINRGISYCAVCDGPLFKDKTVAVVGGGNSALEESLYLSNISKKVYLIHRRDKFTADNILVEKIKSKENIEIITDSVITKLIEKEKKLDKIEINSETTLKIDGLFIYIGNEPNTEFIKEIKKEKGLIIVDNNMQTSIEKIYACGDVIKKDIYQITTAIGEGTIAAINIKKSFLKE